MSKAIELDLPENIYSALKRAAEKNHKTEAELAVEAIEAYLKALAGVDPLLGLFADKIELVDSIAEEIARVRESAPMRAA